MSMLHDSHNRRRGLTVIELLIVTVISVVVLGILYGLLTDTRQTTMERQREVDMQNQARLLCDQIVSVLGGSVSPDSLDAGFTTQTLQSGQQIQFMQDRCVVINSQNFRDGNFYLVTIASNKDQDTKRKNIVHSVRALDSKLMKGITHEVNDQEFNGSDKSYNATVRFDYALTPSEAINAESSFHTELKPGEYPRVIRVHVRMEDPQHKKSMSGNGSFELVTSVSTL